MRPSGALQHLEGPEAIDTDIAEGFGNCTCEKLTPASGEAVGSSGSYGIGNSGSSSEYSTGDVSVN
eukprot:908532-Lingulodinium_polyedra.AAC.1